MRTENTCKRIINHPNFRPFIDALGFTIVDTSLYFFSENNFLKHIGQSQSPVTELMAERDKPLLGFMLIGNSCTLISTQAAYFVIIKNFLTAASTGITHKRRFKLNSCLNTALIIITSLSILNKSIATSSSAFALTYDMTTNPVYLTSVFSLALLSNIVVQVSVQMESMGWRGKFSKSIVIPVSALATTFYNFSLLMLNWNTLNNAFITLGWLESENRVTLDNMLDSVASRAMVAIASPLFVCAAVRNELKFVPFIIERFTPKNKKIQKQSSCSSKILSGINKWTGVGNSLQRTSMMFLAFAALIFSLCENENTGYLLGFGLALLCLRGNWTANFSLLFPAKSEPENKPLKTIPIALNAYPGKIIATTPNVGAGYYTRLDEKQTVLRHYNT